MPFSPAPLTPRDLHLWFCLRDKLQQQYKNDPLLLKDLESDLIDMANLRTQRTDSSIYNEGINIISGYAQTPRSSVLVEALAAIIFCPPQTVKFHLDEIPLEPISHLNADDPLKWIEFDILQSAIETIEKRYQRSIVYIYDKNLDGLWSHSDSKPRPPFRVVNDIDTAELPHLQFIIENYVDELKTPRPGAEFTPGCTCGSNCSDLTACNCATTASRPPIFINGRLTDRAPVAYECNPNCECSQRCSNRTIQNIVKSCEGSRRGLEVFKTKNKGWGVRTCEPIKKGEFIAEYVGELITNEEADKRARLKRAAGYTYFFELDPDLSLPPEEKLVIDATYYCNIARFFNHSCSGGNMWVPINFFVDVVDPHWPRLAFFARRDVAAGEELTFDYFGALSDVSDTQDGGDEQEWADCLCGEPECRRKRPLL